jgi:hypothetical protein
MRRVVTIRNDFHGTAARVRPIDSYVARNTVLRVRRQLCGIAGCTCGGILSERGPQEVVIQPQPDGTVRLFALDAEVFR